MDNEEGKKRQEEEGKLMKARGTKKKKKKKRVGHLVSSFDFHMRAREDLTFKKGQKR